MPFIIARDQPHGKLYIQRDADGDMGWVPNKDKATRFADAEVETAAADFARFSLTEVDVVGAKELAT